MIINCPACNTRYTVEPGLFAGGRRKTRCFNCGNVWAPGAVARPAPSTTADAQEQAPPPQRAAPPPPPPPPPPPVPRAAPDPAPNPAPPPQPVAEKPEPPAPEPAEPDPAPEPTKPVSVSDQPSDQLSDEELNEMLGGHDDPDPVVSMMGDTVGEAGEADDTEAFDPENLPDPDPLPSTLIPEYEEDDDDESSGGIGALIAIIVGVLVIASLAAFIFFRGVIVELVPSVAGVYDMIGLGEPLGDGLDIRQVKSSRSVENTVDILDVSGLIANVTDDARPVPSIKVSLYNAANEEVMNVVTAPQNGDVKGGGRTRFRALLKSPPPTARRLEVSFTTDPITPGATAPIAPPRALDAAPAAAAPAPMKPQSPAAANPAAPAAPAAPTAPPPPSPGGG